MKNHSEHLAMPHFSRYSDTYIKLSKHRVIFVAEDFTAKMGADLSAVLLYLDHEDHAAPIEIYIHSQGGEISGLFNIYDVIQMISAPVKTICVGKCYSAGAMLLAAGTKGQRFAMKNSSIMIHGIQMGFPIPGEDTTNSKNLFKYLEEHNDSFIKILANHTGHSFEKVKQDCLQDLWMTPKQALEYGIIDGIIQ